MGILGFIFSLVAALFMLIGLVPFLGWLNWFTTLPAAILGAVFSSLGLKHPGAGLAAAGLIVSVIVFFIATGRIIVGCSMI